MNSDGFTHLENENDKLISGAENGQLDAWDFKSGNKLHTVQAAHFIQSLKVKWLFVASSIWVPPRIKFNNFRLIF